MAARAALGEIAEKYKLGKKLGSGSFGVTRLATNKQTDQLVAIKFIERGHGINEDVAREIFNHKSLRHPNIIGFEEVLLAPTHLAIAMEYADAGDLFAVIYEFGKFSEDKARYFFQQLISGVSYCHSLGICHRDLTASNLLLSSKPGDGAKPGDGHESYVLKICDFGFSKSSLLHSRPKSKVGTTPYVAPEVFGSEYDGKMADVWSCGVILYVMLLEECPFKDPKDPKNDHKIFSRIMAAQYDIPDDVDISQECKDLLSRIFVANPSERITIQGIKSHTWFLKNLPEELTEAAHGRRNPGLQSDEEIEEIVEKAKVPPALEEEDVGEI